MPNLLNFPSKKTYKTEIESTVRKFISCHSGGHPDEFKDDIQQWQDLRKNATTDAVHVDCIQSILLYHAQLVSILAKLPSDIQLEISFATVFHPRKPPVTLQNIVFERASLLFNLASLYSQLGSQADRSNAEGIKRAVSYYQVGCPVTHLLPEYLIIEKLSAGTLSYLNNATLPKIVYPADDEEIPLDLSTTFIQGLESLMLAQAQECSWQLAKINQYKNSLIAKIAARVSSLYALSHRLFHDASPAVRQILPSDWLPHIEAKHHHFLAVAEFRKSLDDIEYSRYGYEIARLGNARNEAKKAQDTGRRGRITVSVQEDTQVYTSISRLMVIFDNSVKSLLDTVQKSLSRAERDNDLIYHHDVPPSASLPPIQETSLATATIPPGLLDPKSVLGSMNPLFGSLIGWGALEAIKIYNERKQVLVKEQILDVAQDLQDQADEELRVINLPAALEALERPIGLPPSLLHKAEEVRLGKGPERIAVSIDNVQRLAERDQVILDEAMDILDNEASEDEAARKGVSMNRVPSHQANVDLIEKERRYRSILAEAAASDESIRQKWDEWEESIIQLTWDEADLEASVPSSTATPTSNAASQSVQTRNHARSLRTKLEELEAFHHERAELVQQVRALEASDDIQPRILRVASGFERLTELRAEMFEDILDEELAKYDVSLREMRTYQQRQGAVIADIKVINEQFLQSRRDDPLVKDREHALQSLDLAYFTYRGIVRNLEEGFKVGSQVWHCYPELSEYLQFYNDFANILSQFKEVCKAWSSQRRQELLTLQVHKPLQKLSLDDDVRRQPGPRSQHSSEQPSDSRFASLLSQGLPSLDAKEWGFEDIVLPPGPKR
ncbi:pH-response regulator protein palA/rim20 [Leucoagaricus gongylophorus]